MSESGPADRPPDGPASRSRMNLQCIGSFKAYTTAGECHTIEIWTHFGAMHDRDISRVAPSLLILTTTDGRNVERTEQGRYRLADPPRTPLSTDDPNAP